jgi:hypothetical protein
MLNEICSDIAIKQLWELDYRFINLCGMIIFTEIYIRKRIIPITVVVCSREYNAVNIQDDSK